MVYYFRNEGDTTAHYEWPWDFAKKVTLVLPADEAGKNRLRDLGKAIFCPVTDKTGKTYDGDKCGYSINKNKPYIRDDKMAWWWVTYDDYSGRANLTFAANLAEGSNPASSPVVTPPSSPKPTAPMLAGGSGPFKVDQAVRDAGKQLYCDRIPEDKKGQFIKCGFSSTYKKVYYFKKEGAATAHYEWPWDFAQKAGLPLPVEQNEKVRLRELGKKVFCPLTDTNGNTYTGDRCQYSVTFNKPYVKDDKGVWKLAEYDDNSVNARLSVMNSSATPVPGVKKGGSRKRRASKTSRIKTRKVKGTRGTAKCRS